MNTPAQDKFVTVDGLRTRYIEAGSGHPVLLLHGASLGSSADVFLRNLGPLAAGGFRVIAFDAPGFGLTDTPSDLSAAYRRNFIPKFAGALGLKKPSLIAHSQAGNPAVQLALAEPSHYSHIVVLGTGSLLPPLHDADEGRDAAAQKRLERRMVETEPTIEDTRKLLEANLFHCELITPEELALRHSRSIGAAFQAFVARSQIEEGAAKTPKTPLWQRLIEVEIPLMLMFGREDRAHAAERAEKLKSIYPTLNLHIVPECKHLVPWDAVEAMAELIPPFLKS